MPRDGIVEVSFFPSLLFLGKKVRGSGVTCHAQPHAKKQLNFISSASLPLIRSTAHPSPSVYTVPLHPTSSRPYLRAIWAAMASPAPTDASRPTSFSISLGPVKLKPPPRKPAPTFAPKRSAAHLDSDDEDNRDDERANKVQLVTDFDAARGGAVDLNDAPKKAQGPLVIPKLSNRNWREEAERRRGGSGQAKKAIYVPPEALAKQNGRLSKEDLVEKDIVEQKYGLQVFDRKAEETSTESGPTPPADDAPPPAPKTEEEIALASLLSGDTAAPSTLVLAPTSASNGNDWRTARAAVQNEDAAFKTDVASRPEMATLEDYAAVPVEEFGAALLRGMGWKEGDEVGKRRGAASKPRVVEKRPAFLGIGAKAKEEIPELGTWGKGDKKRRGRQDTTYIPVVMVDKKTGKIVDPAQVEAGAGTGATANGNSKGEREKDSGRDRERDSSKRERSRDRSSRSERKDRERSYDSSDRRRRDRERSWDHGGRDRDSGRDRGRRDRDSGRDRERRRDDDRDRRRGDDRRRDDRRDRDRRDRR